MALPLTRQLRTDGDLRRWFEARFRHLDAVAHDVPPRLRCLVRRRTADGIPPWLMGMAFDWRLRLGLEVPADPWATTAFAGWMLAFGDGLDGALHQQPYLVVTDGDASKAADNDKVKRQVEELARQVAADALGTYFAFDENPEQGLGGIAKGLEHAAAAAERLPLPGSGAAPRGWMDLVEAVRRFCMAG